MPDPKKKKAGYSMNLGSKEIDTPGIFRADAPEFVGTLKLSDKNQRGARRPIKPEVQQTGKDKYELYGVGAGVYEGMALSKKQKDSVLADFDKKIQRHDARLERLRGYFKKDNPVQYNYNRRKY